jgi:hypothetical protein
LSSQQSEQSSCSILAAQQRALAFHSHARPLRHRHSPNRYCRGRTSKYTFDRQQQPVMMQRRWPDPASVVPGAIGWT